jgi:regulatory protein
MTARKKPRRLESKHLKDIALDYLAKFASSSTKLKQVMKRRIDLSARAHDDDPAPLLSEMDRVLVDLIAKGILNDATFAVMMTKSLAKRGGSQRKIEASLAAKGVSRADTAQAMEKLREDEPDAEMAAAVAFAKRRRLGAFRARTDDTPERRRKDLGAMARAGFRMDVAKKALMFHDE